MDQRDRFIESVKSHRSGEDTEELLVPVTISTLFGIPLWATISIVWAISQNRKAVENGVAEFLLSGVAFSGYVVVLLMFWALKNKRLHTARCMKCEVLTPEGGNHVVNCVGCGAYVLRSPHRTSAVFWPRSVNSETRRRTDRSCRLPVYWCLAATAGYQAAVAWVVYGELVHHNVAWGGIIPMLTIAYAVTVLRCKNLLLRNTFIREQLKLEALR